MKKVFSFVACLSIAVFAQYQYPPPQQYYYQQQQYPQQQQYQQYGNPEQVAKVQQLIRDGVKKNKEEIQQNSIYLTPAEKTTLYDRNKKKGAAAWAALDFFVGFGIGSYIQGDITYGIAQSIMDAVGYSLYVVGFVNLLDSYVESTCEYGYYNGSWDYNCHEESYGDEDSARTMIVSGLIVIGASRIMSWIFPFSYQKGYNRTLNSALNSNSISYSIDPLILPKDGKPAIGLAFNLNY